MQGSEGVVIRDEVERLAFVLQAQGRLHHAEVIADVETARGLESREDAHRGDEGAFVEAYVNRVSVELPYWRLRSLHPSLT